MGFGRVDVGRRRRLDAVGARRLLRRRRPYQGPDGRTVVGRHLAQDPDGWELNNGLVRVQTNTTDDGILVANCGEQPLPPHGACLLGSFNLVKYVHLDPNTNIPYFDFVQFEADIPHAVRALDNIIDGALYPLPQQAEEAKNKRRMGIGVTGLANAIEFLGFPYGSKEFVSMERQILVALRDTAYNASVDLAIEKGSFPLFDVDKYLEAGFIKTLPEWLRTRIRTYGIRNSHLLSIAPTGTISFTADYVSSSVEPVFEYQSKTICARNSNCRGFFKSI